MTTVKSTQQNDKTTDIGGLQTLLMANGEVFANFTEMPRDIVEIAIGSASAQMRGCAPDALASFGAARLNGLDSRDLKNSIWSEPAEKVPGDTYAVWINELADWALSGTQTIQIMLVDRNAPCRIKIDHPIVIKGDTSDLFLRAHIASHRSKAMLHVTFSDSATREIRTCKVAFAPSFLGGRHSQGYQQVSLPLPKSVGPMEVSLAVHHEEYVDDGSGIEPFVFLADVHVGNQSKPEDSFLSPMMLVGTEIPCDGVWLRADLPAYLMPNDDIHLRYGGKTDVRTIPMSPKISVDDRQGHTLQIESSDAALLSLYIDGSPQGQLSVGPGQTPFRLADKYLDGATHHISIRDLSGTVRLFETLTLVPSILTPADVLQRESRAPFPSSIFAQTPRRFASLRKLFETVTPETDFAQIIHALDTVEAGYDCVTLKPLAFPEVATPKVSIVIPAHNKVEVTYLALCSLLIAPNEASFEVIVVDDGSTDETATLETVVSGITVLHNPEPQRFIRACNAGADQARGEYIVLLNNDVEVTTGWLDELLAAFERFDNVGLAGSKLLYPDGRLQDAGGIIWGTGNPWNYGNRQNPEEPRFCYARQADYLSGAAMMVPKSVWKAVGGLSSYLEPMYFEDTDFAFKVREAGYSTWFVPSSVIYHYEGMTSGTDVSSGFKRYQEINRPKFKRRWIEAYAQFGREGQNPDLEKDRGIKGRVLFVDYTTPRPDQDAGSYAALQEIRLVQSLGYKVSFLPTNLAHLGTYTEDLQKLGVEMIYAPFFLSVQEYLSRHAADFDAFYVTRFYVAQDVLGHLRNYAPEAKILFNNADLHFLREIRAARAENDENRLQIARKTRDEELAIINQVDVVLSYNELEHAVIEAYSEGRATVVRTPWVVDIPAAVPPLSERRGMSFLGSFRHHPNVEGVHWFVREVMSHLSTQQDAPMFSIYGSGMPSDIAALASRTILPVGFVPQVADAYNPHRIFLAPLRSGAGIKGKVIDALAHGIPCVLSPVAAEGIGLRDGQECFIARTPAEWISAISRLNEDDALWLRMSEAARSYVAENYSFTRGRHAMHEAFEAADMFLPGIVAK
ncbi:N-acetylglucosaminyl-diphospho-decaprenol L-rhamnosyltransferase [Roseovarius sp. EC-HK134]|uniref:glycosyltransferase n=1 Tax=unclassified Roseovarius TaxID=2614913 RepID=UPI0012594E7B|nr:MULTISPECIES: glycosyltransferase [unclassified Roseovarius]VVT23797.1 N-acetylglucosaminyl-diphospho-decaprenol L-rhamnosyltransferase [Roseovarius sp. EC-SD190]VVT23956.1 N-acetylglucosaminyl-diphospho-decaprenol L-rhamnosyltransferase [Roseovarius sp. EC-HK134]